jgi:hypothetical protein
VKILVVGSLKDVPSHPELCASFVAKLGELIVERGHTLLNGCRGSLDKAIVEAADARLKALGIRSESQLLGYRLREAEPVHRLGTIRISERKDWDLTHPQLTPPEQIGEADAAIFVAGSEGTFIAANWARIAGIPVLGVSEFGGAGSELYAKEKACLGDKFGRSITPEQFAALNQDTTNIEQLAADIITLAERIVIPHSVFPVLPFSIAYQDVKDSFAASCKEAGFELHGTDEDTTTERIVPRILDGIRRAAFVIADVSEPRPNIFYEIGFAQGLGKPVILTAKSGTELPFDMTDIPVLFWENQRGLKEQLTRRMQSIFLSPHGRGVRA